MKHLALSDINELEDGMQIPAMAGHVKIVFDRKSGTGEYGEWSFQDAILTDGENEVRLKFKSMEDMKSIQGKEVTIRANKSKQHGLTGAVKMVEKYEGNVYHKVQLTPSCKIVVGLPNGENNETLRQPSPTTKHYANKYAKPGDADYDDEIPMSHDDKGAALPGVDEARHHIMQSCNLMSLCIDAADKVIGPHVKGIREELANPDMFQSIVAQLFIESSRSGYIAKMPTKPIK